MKKTLFISATVLSVALFVTFGFQSSARQAGVAEKFSGSETILAAPVSGKYKFDNAHTAIEFRVKHFGLVDVPGFFRDFTGSIDINAADMTKSSVEFSAKMTSVDTGVAGRDNHLRTADFFEVEKYPEMIFKSTKVEMRGSAWYLTGDLTMKGVTKSVTFPFDLVGFLPDARSGGTRVGVVGEATINRRDFGITYGANLPNGAQAISDNVRVVLNIEALAPKAE
jgi:polyisoprenoid-binding protein YceI